MANYYTGRRIFIWIELRQQIKKEKSNYDFVALYIVKMAFGEKY